MDETEVHLRRVFAGIGGTRIVDPRQLSAEQRLAVKILEGVLRDSTVASPHGRQQCDVRRLALAWIRGRLACGCEYESDFDLERVADILKREPEWLRRSILNTLAHPGIRGGVIRSQFVHAS